MGNTDIKQGEIANCYFVSAISAMAGNDERVKTAILTDEINDSGVFAMNVY